MTPCDACGRHAAGRLPCVTLRMVLCLACHENLAAWEAAGGDPWAWPMLDYAAQQAAERAALAARDAFRDRVANAPGRPVPAETRAMVAAWRATNGGAA